MDESESLIVSSYSEINAALGLDAKEAFINGRTAMFIRRFAHRVPNFDTDLLRYQQNDAFYSLVNRTETHFSTQDKKFVSIDASGPKSHLILLDPTSEELDRVYHSFKEGLTLHKRAKIISVLKQLCDFLYHALSIDAHSREMQQKILAEHDSYKSYKYFITHQEIYKVAESSCGRRSKVRPVYAVPLETFFAHHIGVCRHHALATSYFISRLIEDGILPMGHVYNHRDRVKRGFTGKSAKGSPHVWVIYRTERNTVYHIDSFWREARKLYAKGTIKPRAHQHIEKRYGPQVLDLINERLGVSTSFFG